MLNEPVRGVLPDPSFYSQSGLEMLRAYLQSKHPSSPHARLFGYRLTQASSGTVVVSQPISPWFDVYDGFVDLTSTAGVSIYTAALSAAPPAVFVRLVSLSLRYLRPCTVDNESVIARGRLLHAGSSMTTVEVLIEDALGRAVAQATGSVVLEAMDPPPPPMRELVHAEPPVYTTPDPARRPLPAAGTFVPPRTPLSAFLGAEFVEVAPGRAVAKMPATEWFCNAYREVAPEAIGAFASVTLSAAAAGVPEPDERIVTINFTHSFLAPVIPDGRSLEARGTLLARRDESVVFDTHVDDADGRTVLVGQAHCRIRKAAARPGQRTPERLLLTVLFTDIVDSTEHISRLGDARWGTLLDEHRVLVRRAIDLHKGREINTSGDGFLATFDSPTRAVRCARDIRDAVDRLGLRMRAGVHTGECDLVGGDVTGVAVHVASRVQSAAEPGEVLVSATVRDLTAGSDLSLSEHSTRQLKGLEGDWTLFKVE